MQVLVTLTVPEDTDPAKHIAEQMIRPGVPFHFTVTEDSAGLMLEMKDRAIEDLQHQLARYRERPERDEYALRLHKSDPRRSWCGAISVKQCKYCCSLVVEDFLPVHEEVCSARPQEDSHE